MVDTAFSRKLFEQLPTGRCESKGIGYMIEAFVASLTIFIFAVGSVSTPPGQDWNRFQNQIEAQDIGYVLEESGHMDSFLQRSETGSIRTASTTLSGNMEVSGTVQNLPIRRSIIGFHVLGDNIYTINNIRDVQPSDRCSGDLEEIRSEEPVRRTENTRHGAYVYLADSDPREATGFNSETDYDTIWVDNGTRCQFTTSEGPHYIDEIFFWGNESDGTPDDHYDLKDMQDDGSSFTIYNATQVVRFRNTMNKPVNGIKTDTAFDTFTFSVEDLDVYRVLVFRREPSLNLLDTNPERDRLLDYMRTGSALFLMDLQESHLQSGFMSETGLKWIDLNWTSRPSNARFTDSKDSETAETYFIGQYGDENSVSMLPGGNISSANSNTIMSGDKLVQAGSTQYNAEKWNATDTSLNLGNGGLGNVPPGCGSPHRHGDLQFPENSYTVVTTELGESSCSGKWALSIDLNQDGDIDSNEGLFVTGERLEVDNRSYSVNLFPSTCSGECAEFIFRGNPNVELVNYRESFNDQEIGGFARAGYEAHYSKDERKLLASTIYWLAGDHTSFGSTESNPVSTSVIGGIKNATYIPYKISLRWSE